MNIALGWERDYSGRFTYVDIGSARLYFSYRTLIGLWVQGYPALVAVNIWSNTTGRHIAMIGCRHETVTVSSQTLQEMVYALFTVHIETVGVMIDAYIAA